MTQCIETAAAWRSGATTVLRLTLCGCLQERDGVGRRWRTVARNVSEDRAREYARERHYREVN